jgi:hypothetical protein
MKMFALDYAKGNPKPVNYFNAAPGGAENDFQLTPDLIADTYRQIIQGVNPMLILICIVLAIVIAGIGAYLAYNAGVETKNALLGIQHILQSQNTTKVVK